MFNGLETSLTFSNPVSIADFYPFKDMYNYTHPVKVEYPSDMGSWVVYNDTVKFSNLDEASFAEFNGVLYVIAGKQGTSFQSIVYYSSDKGKTWKQYKASFGGRCGSSAVVFGSFLYLLGGEVSSGLTNEIWRTSDGRTWELVTSSSPFTARKNFMSAAFGSSVVIAGGTDALATELWQSKDGVNWVRKTAALPFSLEQASMVVFGSDILIIGGKDGAAISNSVYSSSDLINWTTLTATAFASGLYGTFCYSTSGVLYVFGGNDGSSVNSIYRSFDGVSWSAYTALVGFTARDNFGVSFIDGVLTVFGDADDTIGFILPCTYYLDGVAIPSGSSAVLWDSAYHELFIESLVGVYAVRFCTLIGGHWEAVTSLALHQIVISGDHLARFPEGTSCYLAETDMSDYVSFDVSSVSFDGTNTTIVTTSSLSSGDFVCPVSEQESFLTFNVESSATFLSDEVEKFLNIASLKPEGRVIESSRSLDMISDRVFCCSFYSGDEFVSHAVVKAGDYKAKLLSDFSIKVIDEFKSVLIDDNLCFNFK